MSFEDALEAYMSVKKQKGKTLERDRYSFSHLSKRFSGRSLYSLKRHEIRAYIAFRETEGVKQLTIQRELCLLSAAINFVRTEFELDALSNPVSSLGFSAREHRVRWITREEAAYLISKSESSIRPHLSIFIRLALNTGCRKGELLNLEWDRVYWEQRQILLEARHTKSRKRRTVPLNDDAFCSLRRMKEWQNSKGVDTSWVFGYEKGKLTTLKTSWTTALNRAGIEDFRIHDLRHTFASWLVMQGKSIYVVKALLGHASVTQTEIYAHLAPDQGAFAVQRLLPF